MGTSWSAKIVGGTPALGPEIQSVLDCIVAQMSHWEPGSDLSRFNRAAPGSWQQLPPEFSRVLAAGLAVAAASNGAFDPAMGALADLWGFGPPGPRAGVPDSAEIAQALTRSGRRGIEHDSALLRARRTAPASLDFSGIAKGYAVDAVAGHLRAAGFADFLVEVGGELVGEGIKPDGQPWWIDLEPVPGAALPGIRVALHGLAVATSGDYRRHFTAAGRRYAHTLDPRTGAPLENGVASVSVLHPQCMLADAWATALGVLGPAGLAVAEREGLAMHMVVRQGAGVRELLSPALLAMLE
ncbi:MAG: FAD:protein FMN transferase [Pseudomonadota bacterium]